MSHLVFEVLQAKIEKNCTFLFLTDFVYQYTCINTFFFFFFFFFFYKYIYIKTFFFFLKFMYKYFFFFFFCLFCLSIYMHKNFFFFYTDLSGTGQKRKKLYDHIGNLARLSKKGRKVIGQLFLDNRMR